MRGRAPAFTRLVFGNAAIFQLILLYYALRFSPLWPESLARVTRVLDIAFGLATPAWIVRIFFEAYEILRSPIERGALFVGCLAFGLLAFYPVQLAWGGQEWWDCVRDEYPDQSAAMPAYIYVPATMTFAALIFGATLLVRRIISEATFGVAILGFTLATLLATVLMQEVYFPVVSTQRLYIACPRQPAASTWERFDSA